MLFPGIFNFTVGILLVTKSHQHLVFFAKMNHKKMTPKKFTKKYEGYLHALVQSGPKIKLPSCFPEMEFIGCSYIGDYVSRKGLVISKASQIQRSHDFGHGPVGYRR